MRKRLQYTWFIKNAILKQNDISDDCCSYPAAWNTVSLMTSHKQKIKFKQMTLNTRLNLKKNLLIVFCAYFREATKKSFLVARPLRPLKKIPPKNVATKLEWPGI